MSETESTHTWVENGILYHEVKKGLRCFDFETAVALALEQQAYSTEGPLKAVLLLNDVVWATWPAIGFYRTDVPYAHISGLHIVSPYWLVRWAGRRLWWWAKPPVPIRFCRSTEQAVL